jgi:hypothetical protein
VHALPPSRLAALVFSTAGVALVPWTVWLTSSLPTEHRTMDWDLAWVGFDSILAASFLLTAVAAWRRLSWLPAAAAATGALLLADAWFDILLETRADRELAVFEAVAAELPLALLCFGVAYVTSRGGGSGRGRA